MRVASRSAITVGLALAAIGVAAGTAHATTVTIGSPLTATFTQSFFISSATVANSKLPANANAASPTDGTVISWRFIGNSTPTPRVVHPTGANTYTGAGTGSPQANTAAPPAISGPFATGLPIKKGDLFGVSASAGSLGVNSSGAGAQYLFFSPALADGAAGRAPTSAPSSEEAVSAVVRYCLVPDLKGKSGNAARTALQAADCTAGTAKKAKKRRKKKRVLSQSVAPGSSVADTAPIDFKISRLKKG